MTGSAVDSYRVATVSGHLFGLASSLSATVNESKKIGPRYLVDGVLVCASSDLCVSSLKVESPG